MILEDSLQVFCVGCSAVVLLQKYRYVQCHLGAVCFGFILYDIWHFDMAKKTQGAIGKGSYTNMFHKSLNL